MRLCGVWYVARTQAFHSHIFVKGVSVESNMYTVLQSVALAVAWGVALMAQQSTPALPF